MASGSGSGRMGDRDKISPSGVENESGAEPRRLPVPGPLSPIEAFTRLRGLPGRVLLETAPPWQGRTLLTAAPRAVVGGRAGHCGLRSEAWLRWDGDVGVGGDSDGPGLDLLGRAMDALSAGSSSHPGSSALPSGGWFGVLGYELGGEIESLPSPPPGGLTPDLWFGAYDWCLSWPDGPAAPPVVAGRPLPGDHEGRELDRLLEFVLARLRRGRVPGTGEDPSEPAPGAGLDPSEWEGCGPDASFAIPRAPAFTGWAPLGGRRGARISLSRRDYLSAVERVREYIRAGDLFQANLTCQVERPIPPADDDGASEPGVTLYRRMRDRSPAPYAACLDLGDAMVVSISPESFLERAGRTLKTRPIKGTRPRGHEAASDAALARELVGSGKDRAENVMIVDLLRNDLSRIAKPNSVYVSSLLQLETHPTVHHLVSEIRAELADGAGWSEILAALFPGGSITGAPKIRAMEILAELEPLPRGPYTGAVGRVGFDGDATLSIAIRTAVVRDGVARYGAGGGITLASEPDAEWRELLDKAEAFLDATEPS